MKTILNNKQNYRTKIGCLGTNDNTLNGDLLDHQAHSFGTQEAAGGTSGGFSSSDENGESSSEEEAGTSTGLAGTKRKVTESGESSERVKQRKV